MMGHPPLDRQTDRSVTHEYYYTRVANLKKMKSGRSQILPLLHPHKNVVKIVPLIQPQRHVKSPKIFPRSAKINATICTSSTFLGDLAIHIRDQEIHSVSKRLR